MSTEGDISSRFWRAMFFCVLLLFIFVWMSRAPLIPTTAQTTSVPVVPIITGDRPITVKITNSEVKTAMARVVETNEAGIFGQGNFTFSACLQGQHISVWSPGYYTESVFCNGSSPAEYPVQLDLINSIDNPGYVWVGATGNCANCHSGQTINLAEYPEWKKDGHSSVFADPYFWTTYTGTNVAKNPGIETKWEINGEGKKQRVPSQESPYGPGFRLDYPRENGNCAYCHAPAALRTMQQGTDLISWNASLPGNPINVETEGITCDVCHKVTDVLVGGDGLPFADHPGVLSMSFMRPSSPDLFFTGPKPFEVTPQTGIKKTCSPIFSESRFCAGCHYGKFGDVVIYNSYGEWKESIYSQKNITSSDGQTIEENKGYRSCQDCHMLSPEQIGETLPSQRDACSEKNLNFRDFNHNMMNYGPDPDYPAREIPLLVKKAATVSIEGARKEDGLIKFTVTVLNNGAGHKFPTDSPLRHLILLVQTTAQNTPLPQISGPTIPVWGARDLAGYPGEIYANLLKDKDTNKIPTVAYWDSVELGSDTRLVPGEPVRSEYSFVAPSNGNAVITARLIYRKAFYDIVIQKGWPLIDLDIEAAKASVEVMP